MTSLHNTPAARQQAGLVLATHRAFDVLRAILSTNHISPDNAVRFKTLTSGDLSTYGTEAIAKVCLRMAVELQQATGIDDTLDAMLNADNIISAYKPYGNGYLRGQNPADYIDRDHLAAWEKSLDNLGVREDGTIYGFEHRDGAVQKKLHMTWREYLNQ